MNLKSLTAMGSTHLTAPSIAALITLCIAKLAVVVTGAPLDDVALLTLMGLISGLLSILVTLMGLVSSLLSILVIFLHQHGYNLDGTPATIQAESLTQHITVTTPPSVTVTTPPATTEAAHGN